MSFLRSTTHLSPSWWMKRDSTPEVAKTYEFKVYVSCPFPGLWVCTPRATFLNWELWQPHEHGKIEGQVPTQRESRLLPHHCTNWAQEHIPLLSGNAPKLLLNLFRFYDQKCIFKGDPMMGSTQTRIKSLWACLSIFHFIIIWVKIPPHCISWGGVGESTQKENNT